MLCVHIILIVAHFAAFIQDGRLIIVLIFLQLLDLKSTKGYFKACFTACKKMALIFVVGVIMLDFCLIFFCTQPEYQSTSFAEMLKLFCLDIYYIFILGNFDLSKIENQLEIAYTVMEIYFIVCMILFVFGVSHEIYAHKKEEKSIEKKCLICLKTDD